MMKMRLASSLLLGGTGHCLEGHACTRQADAIFRLIVNSLDGSRSRGKAKCVAPTLLALCHREAYERTGHHTSPKTLTCRRKLMI